MLSGHIAVAAQNAGVGPVALIDTDPQGSLSHWWNARKAPEPLFVKVGPNWERRSSISPDPASSSR